MLVIMISVNLYSIAHPPSPSEVPGPPPPTELTLDDKINILLLLGVVLGVYVILGSKRNNERD